MVRIALAQVNPTVGDLAGNRRKVVRFYRDAVCAGADLVVFPELVLTGYPPQDLLLRRDFLDAAERELEALCGEISGGAAALVGAPRREGDALFNSCCVMRRARVLGWYDKVSLPNYGVFDEKRYFRPGGRPALLSFGGVPFAVNVCEDSWDPEGPFREQCRAGAAVVLNLSASPFHLDKHFERVERMAGIAREFSVPFVYCNLVGGQDELVFDGGSFVLDTEGRTSASLGQFEEGLLVVDVEPGGGTGKDGGAGGLPVIDAGGPGTEEKPPLPEPGSAGPADREDQVLGAVVLGTGDYIRKNGFGRVVVGVSGGIDSAVTLALAVEALGAENVTGVVMPGPYSSRETQEDAFLLCRNLGVEALEVPIAAVVDAVSELLEKAVGRPPEGLARENLQARARGLILMTISNASGALVLTTGNKSEAATGYCTLYGDTVGAFAPIKDVPKTMVWRLARRFNRNKGGEIIPESIISRAPSAELRPDQKDEDSLPPYEVLDRILEAYIEEGLSIDEMTARGLPREDVVRTVALIDRSEYKRFQVPPGVKITPRAFGKDWRRPITNRFRPSGTDGGPA